MGPVPIRDMQRLKCFEAYKEEEEGGEGGGKKKEKEEKEEADNWIYRSNTLRALDQKY